MAILPGGISDYGISRLCEKRGFSLHKVSGNRSAKASVSANSFRYPQNEMGGKKRPRKSDGLSYRNDASTWWLPLFGWSPDQKWAEEKQEKEDRNSIESVQNLQRFKNNEKSDEEKGEDGIQIKRRSKSVPVHFTAEKAKILRKTLRTTSSFHDLMYHSAIASRLASADISSSEKEEDSKKEEAC